MPDLIEKVTAFVTRQASNGPQLLLFEHPFAGIQLPAGSVEVNEKPEDAALREAWEETGLSDLTITRYLGWRDDPPPPGHGVIGENTTAYSRPDQTSFDFIRLPRGMTVKLERTIDGYSQVTYREMDRMLDPRYVSYLITGWVLTEALAKERRRYFYRLACKRSTPQRWTVEVDYHRFELFWAPLADLPEIVSTQAGWLEMLRKQDF